MPTLEQLGQQYKQQYPELAGLSDLEVGMRAKARYPQQFAQYSSAGIGSVAPPPTLGQRAIQNLKDVGNEALGMVASIGKTAGNLLESIGGSTLNALQALTPGLKVPGATDQPIPLGTSLPGVAQYGIPGSNLGARTGALVNAATLGQLDQISKRMEAERQDRTQRQGNAPVQGIGPQIEKVATQLYDDATGALKYVGLDVLPGEKLGQLATSRNAKGEPLSAFERGELVSDVPLQVLGALATTPGLRKLIPGAQEGLVQAVGDTGDLPTRKVVTQQQIDFAKAQADKPIFPFDSTQVSKGGMGAEISTELPTAAAGEPTSYGKKPLPDNSQLLADTMTPEQKAATALNFRLEAPQVRAVMNKVVSTELFKAVRVRNLSLPLDEQPRFTKNVTDALREGALSPDDLLDVQQRYNLTPAQVAEQTAQLIEFNMSKAGGMLKVANDARQLADWTLQSEFARTGNPELFKQIKLLEQETNSKGPASIERFASIYKTMEKTRRSLLVSGMSTQARNLITHSGIGLNQAFEHLVSGAVEGIATGEFKFSDLKGDFATLVDRMSPEGRKALEGVLDQLPLVKNELTSASQFDLQMNILRRLQKGQLPQGAAETIEGAAGFWTAGMHIGNIELRKAYFQQRLLSNLEAHGFISDAETGVSGLRKFEEYLKSPESLDENGNFNPEHQALVADAFDHALKQTMSWTPTGGIGKAVLQFYSKLPFSTFVLPTFPRFWMNQVRWLTERAPGSWLELFDKDFRDTLGAGGVSGRQSARQLGKAFTGLMNLGAAWTLRNSDAAGPKYYQFKVGQEQQGNQRMLETDAYHPFTPYLFAADLIRKIKDPSAQLNLNNRELLDAITLMRGITDTPGFAVSKGLESLGTEEVDKHGSSFTDRLAKWVVTPAAQYFASFFSPARTIHDWQAVGGDPNYTRDIKGHEATGVFQELIAPSTLPIKPDVFTGRPAIAEVHPGIHQLTGLRWHDYPKLAQTLEQFPEISTTSLVGEQGSPTANRLVTAEIGTIMAKVGDQLAERLNSLPASVPRSIKAHVIREVFAGLRDEARQSAMVKAYAAHGQEGLAPFLNKELEKLPPELQPAMRRALEARGIQISSE